MFAVGDSVARPGSAAHDAVAIACPIVRQSRARCSNIHKLDPAAGPAPTLLTTGELSEHLERSDRLRTVGGPEFDRLYSIVAPLGYVVLIADETGTVIDHRGDLRREREFMHWGIWRGGIWNEAVEGTNGIGTCLAAQKPVTVHAQAHYRNRHASLSCSGAPIRDVDGSMIGVLDLSSCDPAASEGAHALAGALVATCAADIEERLFREQLRDRWILALRGWSGPGLLFAVDDERRIAAANSAARDEMTRLGADGTPPLWSLFERNEPLFRCAGGEDNPGRLVQLDGGASWIAVATPPRPRHRRNAGHEFGALSWRPRLSAMTCPGEALPTTHAQGGLSPATLRRVQDYVEANLDRPLDLRALAVEAGLSPFHFARMFRRAVGIAPHAFVVSRRIAKAQDLLSTSDLSISEIAHAAGFADHGHLGRHFKAVTGMSPQQFRRAPRPLHCSASGPGPEASSHLCSGAQTQSVTAPSKMEMK